MNAILQDLIYGIRMLRKKPAFTAIAALSLALGIGGNTAIFTLINTILLGSLPYPDVDRVVAIQTVPPQHSAQPDYVSVPDYLVWKERNRTFQSIGVVTSAGRDFGAEENGVPPERLQGENVTPDLFQSLGVRPLLGRIFVAAEDQVDHPAPVMVLSYRLWQSRFGGDKDIFTRNLLVDGVRTQIIGVMPPDFRIVDENALYYTPIPFNSMQLRGSGRFMFAVGRMKSGVSIAQAQADMDAIAAQLAREAPARDTDHGKPWGVRVMPVRQPLFGYMSRPLLLLQGAVAFVLLIACANVGGLLLARASSRQKEVAIRSALGAGRGRIIRQFLTESLILSAAGGALGLLLGWWGVRALVAMAPDWFPRLHQTTIDARVLCFSAGMSLVTGLLFGVGPAIRGSRANLGSTLKESVRGGTSGGSQNRWRGVLVAVQFAMALLLLIGAGLLIRSFQNMQRGDLGCDPRGLLTFRLRVSQNQAGHVVNTWNGLPLWHINNIPSQLFSQMMDRTRSMPGVRSAGAIVYPPFNGTVNVNFSIIGKPAPDADAQSAEYYPITPNYFATMKTPIVRGRDFNALDTVSSPWVAIINETMAHRFWPNEDPIGKRITIDISPDEQPREIVAVVHDVPSDRLQTAEQPAMFIDFLQVPGNIMGPIRDIRMQMTFVYRTAGEPMAMLAALRSAVREIDPNKPLVDPKTVEQYLAEQIQYPRYYSMLLGLFAAAATLLAAIGIYGVMAYAVAQRTREIGIRMALGARGSDVLKLVLRQVLILIAAGLALGLGGAIALTRYLSSELWEVKATDPITFVSVSLVLIAVAIAACLIPTRRAVQIDPTVALRYE
jgi:putative ABC transport system permease protein